MDNHICIDYDVLLEESLNEVNEEYTTRKKVQIVNQTLHFDNRFAKDKKTSKISNLCAVDYGSKQKDRESDSSVEVIIYPRRQRNIIQKTMVNRNERLDKYMRSSNSFEESAQMIHKSIRIFRKISSSMILSSIHELQRDTKH